MLSIFSSFDSIDIGQFQYQCYRKRLFITEGRHSRNFHPFSFFVVLLNSCFSLPFCNLFYIALALFLRDSLKIAQIPLFTPFHKALHDVVFLFLNIYLSEDPINQQTWATDRKGLVRRNRESERDRVKGNQAYMLLLAQSISQLSFHLKLPV